MFVCVNAMFVNMAKGCFDTLQRTRQSTELLGFN